jgi:hypothetical protein
MWILCLKPVADLNFCDGSVKFCRNNSTTPDPSILEGKEFFLRYRAKRNQKPIRNKPGLFKEIFQLSPLSPLGRKG